MQCTLTSGDLTPRHPRAYVRAPAPTKEKTGMQMDNGVPADRIAGAVWRKSTHSAPGGNCVELAALPEGGVAVRDSHRPSGPALIHTRAEIAAFLDGVRGGEFDGTSPEAR